MKRHTYATVIADSLSPDGHRITTMELCFPRFILAELNTHRAFSRNSASSRARSVKKTIQEVADDPFVPVHWPSERVGMAGGETVELAHEARSIWQNAVDSAVIHATALTSYGVHKSIVNRVLEPFMWHTAVVTATDWANFLDQRLALLEDGTPAAEPHFYDLAMAMNRVLSTSQPVETSPHYWHTPYVSAAEFAQIANTQDLGSGWLHTVIKVSVARCAGVSYLNQATDRPLERDLALYDRLRAANPPHWSPFEHVATPVATLAGDERSPRRYNLTGWESLRHALVEGTLTGEDL